MAQLFSITMNGHNDVYMCAGECASKYDVVYFFYNRYFAKFAKSRKYLTSQCNYDEITQLYDITLHLMSLCFFSVYCVSLKAVLQLLMNFVFH